MNAIPEGKLLQAKLEFDEDSFQPAIITRLDNEKENKDDDDDIMLEQKNLVEKVGFPKLFISTSFAKQVGQR